MIKKLIFCIFLLVVAANAVDNNITNPFPPATIVKDNIATPTDSNDTKNWNNSDWKNYFDKKGSDESVIGNAQAMMGGSPEADTAFIANPNNLTNDAVKDKFKNNQAIQDGWSDSLQQDIASKAASNAYISLLDTKPTIQCYITRDISFKWKCNETGLVYGGTMNASGRVAKENCENDCYEQHPCTNLNPDPADSQADNGSLACDFSTLSSCTMHKNLDVNKVTNKLFMTFDENQSNQEYLIDLNITNAVDKSRLVLKNLRRSFSDSNLSIDISEPIKSFTLTVKKFNADDNVTKVNIPKVVTIYKKSNKFICRALQDINVLDAGNFAYSCAEGNIRTFSLGTKIYKICNSGGLGADNEDGTFSNEKSCLSACKTSSKCVPDFTTFTTTALKTFREGCIEGQPGCSNTNEDCKVSRLKGDKVLNEAVFDATANKRITIQNSVEAKDARRPRVDPGEDLSFERKNQEEWKDEAFKDMATRENYTYSSIVIGEESLAQNSYRIGMKSGASYGYVGTASRAFFWNLKPKTFDVSSGNTFYLYAIIVANLGYHDYDETANLVQKTKQIWYIKTSSNDTFKAIKRGLDVSLVTLDDNNNTVKAPIATSALQDETFTGSNWVGLTPSQTAEYFKTQTFDDTKYPFWKFTIVNELGNLLYDLPGLVRSMTRTPAAYDQPVYTGHFDGTGDGLLNYSVYVYYSKEQLTYSQLYQKIDDKEMKKIYKQGEEYLYPKKLASDSEDNTHIKLYQYGEIDKTSLMMSIHPKREDVGKKGFIFVFIQ